MISAAPSYDDSEGMTLRDYLAAAALPALLTNKNILLDDAAELAYKMADAMLEARK